MKRFGLILTGLILALPALSATAIEPGTPPFERTWERTDKPVVDGVIDRTWMWGPARTGVMTEPYQDSPGGERQVQYFDKSRMELTYPGIDPSSPWTTTNGLLVVEMMTGRTQIGNDAFTERVPAEVNIAGDPDDPFAPTYATFASLMDEPPLGDDELIIGEVHRDGSVLYDGYWAQQDQRAGPLIPETNHRVANVFWEFLHSSGPIYDQEHGMVDDRLFDPWYYASGLPITEAYWMSIYVNGSIQDVLVQAFERRVLTWTPGNPEGWQVEAGNVGRHYYIWRYGVLPEQPEGTIAFLRTPTDGDEELDGLAFTIQADGTRERSLGPALDPPQLSPDGLFVIWTTQIDGDAEIIVARSDGSDPRTLTDNLASDRRPVWSPDGSLIAFERDGVIWVMDADGSDQRPVSSAGDGRKSHPRWSPDGTKIAYYNTTDPIGRYSGINVVNIDGTGETGVVSCAGWFTWMPNGLEIVAGQGGYIGCIYVPVSHFIVGIDGSNLRPLEVSLPDGLTFSGGISFSPDGRMVAFHVWYEDAAISEIFVARSDFSDARRVTVNTSNEDGSAWSPDGLWIAFSDYRDIYIVNIDDSASEQPVTMSAGMDDRHPMWR